VAPPPYRAPGLVWDDAASWREETEAVERRASLA